MDLDDFDDFDDMGSIPPKPDKPMRPHSQMFEEPLHIEEDTMNPRASSMFSGFGDGMMSTSSLPPLDSVPADLGDSFSQGGMAGRAPPSAAAPVFVASEGGGFGIGGRGNRAVTVCACCLVLAFLLLILVIIGLSVAILVILIDTNDDVNNLQFKVQVPTNPPPPSLPPQIGGYY